MEQVLQGATQSDLADQGQDEHDGQGRTGQQNGRGHVGSSVVKGLWGYGVVNRTQLQRGLRGRTLA